MTKFAQLRSLLQPLPAAALVLLGAAVTLAGAWTFQSLGFEPCELCLKQRYPYYAALPLATAAIFLARNAPPYAARLLLALLAVIFVASAVVGGYHAGVEWKFWPGPTDCTGDFVKPASMEDFRRQMETTRIIRCDEVSLRILGLSLADWNVLVSAGIALVAALGATAPKKS
ncbi:disulfide bond formation protein B [Rhodoblastus sp.]|jgi:disulfide bond formation protein DsbB|uniref:disulfide bond formation protein B n=1 Tax=Rhodoblastus sp. TaxID=1962975 RepID=UPI0025D925CF|nr:disulfide bond formation protein B [Rhodoblastus sp.]